MRGEKAGRARNVFIMTLMVGGTGLEQTSNRKQPTASDRHSVSSPPSIASAHERVTGS